MKTKGSIAMLKMDNNEDPNKGEYAIGCCGVTLIEDMDYQGAQRAWKQFTPVVMAAMNASAMMAIEILKKIKPWEKA